MCTSLSKMLSKVARITVIFLKEIAYQDFKMFHPTLSPLLVSFLAQAFLKPVISFLIAQCMARFSPKTQGYSCSSYSSAFTILWHYTQLLLAWPSSCLYKGLMLLYDFMGFRYILYVLVINLDYVSWSVLYMMASQN